VYETYVDSIEPPLDAPISAYGGLQDDRVSHERLEAWRTQTRGAFSTRKFPGGHSFLRTADPADRHAQAGIVLGKAVTIARVPS